MTQIEELHNHLTMMVVAFILVVPAVSWFLSKVKNANALHVFMFSLFSSFFYPLTLTFLFFFYMYLLIRFLILLVDTIVDDYLAR